MTYPVYTMKISFYTLGCKLNFSETSEISRSFAEKGYTVVPFGETADIVVINTCTVTSRAEKKCRNIIRKAAKKHPGAFLIITGCYSQVKAEEIASIQGVDLVLGSAEKSDILKYAGKIEKKPEPKVFAGDIGTDNIFSPAYSLSGRTRSFLKVQDGCDYFCSYCTIPYARGRSRNAPVAAVIEQVKKIAERGVKEIVLTGVNVGDFGKSTGESFHGLLQQLEETEGIERYRISSIEPNLLTRELISLVAGSRKIAPHFHIPLQSGSNEVLARMNRKYPKELFEKKVEEIRSSIPDAGIGVDVITGFPGESKKNFEETYNLLDNSDVSYLHVFSYSERGGTKASLLDGKAEPVETEYRSKLLHELSGKKRDIFNRRSAGSVQFVIFEEGSGEKFMSGYTGNYIRVKACRDTEFVNQMTRVMLIAANDDGSMKCRIV